MGVFSTNPRFTFIALSSLKCFSTTKLRDLLDDGLESTGLGEPWVVDSMLILERNKNNLHKAENGKIAVRMRETTLKL